LPKTRNESEKNGCLFEFILWSSHPLWVVGKGPIHKPVLPLILPLLFSSLILDPQKNTTTNKKITFWFATGGAGFCLSRALTLKMLPIAGGGKFISIGDKIRFPDDVTMGFIIGAFNLETIKGPAPYLTSITFYRTPFESPSNSG